MPRVIVVIGASRGLGLELCHQYLVRGDKVYACCRKPEQASELLAMKQEYADRLETVPLDVNNEGMLKNLPHAINESVDILIHNAGIYGPKQRTFDQVEAKDWMEVLHTNTVAPLMVIQQLADKVSAGHEKKIILMSSKVGSMGDNNSGGSYMYRSSKAALNSVGKSLSIDLKDRGIKVAIVHPGWVRTDMGGPNGLIDVETSITGLVKVIDSLTEAKSGQFLAYDGAEIPW